LFNTLTECSEKIKTELKLIDEENNNLPIDGFKWLAFINADIQDLMGHIEKFDSYDLG
jgi:hypothetical protein